MYYECIIISRFILYKTYLELFCRITYNNVDKKTLPGFLSELKDDYRKLSFCDHRNCIATKENKVSFIVLKETTNFCLQIKDICGKYINLDFVTDILMSYERGKDYFTINLDIERECFLLMSVRFYFQKISYRD